MSTTPFSHLKRTELRFRSVSTTSNMSAAVGSLVSYRSDSDSENDSESNASPQHVDPDAVAHLLPLKSNKTMSLAVLNAAPEVAVKVRFVRSHTSFRC